MGQFELQQIGGGHIGTFEWFKSNHADVTIIVVLAIRARSVYVQPVPTRPRHAAKNAYSQTRQLHNDSQQRRKLVIKCIHSCNIYRFRFIAIGDCIEKGL